MVSQLAHAKYLGEPCMAYVENLYNTLDTGLWHKALVLILNELCSNMNPL